MLRCLIIIIMCINGSKVTFGIELEFVNGDSDAIARELYDLGNMQATLQCRDIIRAERQGNGYLNEMDLFQEADSVEKLISPVLTDTPETWQQIETICQVARAAWCHSPIPIRAVMCI